MNILDGKPRAATQQHIDLPWRGTTGGKRFRCYLCGHRFQVGDIWRFVLATHRGERNLLVCQPCDGPDVLDRWVAACEESRRRFWWLYEDLDEAVHDQGRAEQAGVESGYCEGYRDGQREREDY